MRLLTRVLAALVLILGLTIGSGGFAPTARADDSPSPSPSATDLVYNWAVGPCEPGYSVEGCAYLVMDGVVSSVDQAAGTCSLGERCVQVVKDEAEFWTHIDTWETAQAALSGYTDYRQNMNTAPFNNIAGKALAQEILDTAQAWVNQAFDPVTHVYNSSVPPKAQIPPLPTMPDPTPLKSFSKTYTPTLSGTTKVGKVLKAKVKGWNPSASFSYQWNRNGIAIPGATGAKYKLAGADKGARISVTVTGTRSGYTTLTKTSKSTKTIKAATMPRGKVKVVGRAKVGLTVTAKTYSKWASGVTFTYQWYRGKRKIAGAITQTYVPTATDRGKRLKVKVVATKLGYKTVSRTSRYSGKVKAGVVTPPAVTPSPTPTPVPTPTPTVTPSPSPSPDPTTTEPSPSPTP